MTVQEMINAPMVVADNTRTGRNTALHQIQLAGLEPTIATVTESFLIMPFRGRSAHHPADSCLTLGFSGPR